MTNIPHISSKLDPAATSVGSVAKLSTVKDLSTQTWAITGAAGKIGSGIRACFASRLKRLVSIDSKEITDVAENETSFVLDIRDARAVLEALTDCDGVIHLAGMSDEADFHDLGEVNILGTYHVLEAARRNRLKRVVFASTTRVTGFYPIGQTVDPSMPTRPDGFFGVSKIAGESLMQLYSDKFGLSTITLRIGMYEKLPTSARDARAWLSYADACRAFEAAITTEAYHAVIYAISRNKDRWWDLSAGFRIGFLPEDDASNELDNYDFPSLIAPQSGAYTSAMYSLDRMNHT